MEKRKGEERKDTEKRTNKKKNQRNFFNFYIKKLNNNNKYNISTNFSGATVGTVGPVQCQIFPCSGLYLFSKSAVTPQMHSLSLTAGLYSVALPLLGQSSLLSFP